MDLNTPMRPADRLVVLVNTGLAALWFWAGREAAYAQMIGAAHVAGAVLPWLFVHRNGRSRLLSWLRELYPLILVIIVWTEMGLIREVMHVQGNDAVVAAADIAVFGRHLQVEWMPAMPYRWFSEGMFFVYVLYYPAVFLSPVVLLMRRRYDAARDVIFSLSLAYFACYALYAVFPVDGPTYTMTRYAGPLTEGLFYQLAVGAVHAADSMGTAFPSSHVIGAVTMALLAWRWFSRPVAVAFALEAVGVVLSTVYTQNHFAIDSLAGLVFAVATFAFLRPVVRGLLSPHERAVIPPLPRFPSTSSEFVTGGER